MSVSLSEGGNVSLTKMVRPPSRTAVAVGLGWDERTTTGPDFDLDASALLRTVAAKVVEDPHFVFFNNLTALGPDVPRPIARHRSAPVSQLAWRQWTSTPLASPCPSHASSVASARQPCKRKSADELLKAAASAALV